MTSQPDKPRFHVPAIPPVQIDQDPPRVELSAGEAHHALHVLRLAGGNAVELFDGRGASAPGRILMARHGAVSVVVEAAAAVHPRPGPAIHLAFAVPKGKRLDWLLEKASELGAASLWPVTFQRSVAGADELSEGKMERWQAHCIAAAKQCGLDFLPEIRQPQRLEDLAQCAGGEMLRLFGDLSAGAVSVGQALLGRRKGQPVLILVGPEGGLTDAESSALRELGFRGVRLGETTLRIETAALALLAATLAVAE